MFGESNVSPLKQAIVTRWEGPFSRGSYTYPRVNQLPDDPATVALPVHKYVLLSINAVHTLSSYSSPQNVYLVPSSHPILSHHLIFHPFSIPPCLYFIISIIISFIYFYFLFSFFLFFPL